MISGHIVVDYTKGNVGTAKFYVKDDTDGSVVLKHEIPMGNCTVADGFGTDGHCPPGDYHLDAPEACAPPESAANVPYGFWFTPLIDFQGLWSKSPVPAGVTRAGIGAHGGGSNSATPFADDQGELADLPTDGCHRMKNADNNAIFVPFVQYIRAQNPAPDSIVFSVVR